MNGVIESQRGEIYRAHQGDEQLRRDQQLLHERLLEQNRELREAHVKSLNEMEELKRFQGSTFGTIPRRKVFEDRDTILELTGKIQELQNKINCMNDSRDFNDAESVRRGQDNPTLPVNQCFFPPHPVPGGMLSRSIGIPSRKDGPPSIWDTHGISGNVFANPVASSSSAPYPQELNPWSSHMSEPIHSSTAEKNWIKEVEMVDSVDDLKSSSSVRGNQMPDFEVLDARIASALNRIIRSSLRFV